MFVRKKRAPARKAKGKAKGRKAAKRKAGLRLPSLEQRHLDLLGLLLVAFGVYLVFVLFFGWEGGKVGSGVETALTYLPGNATRVRVKAVGDLTSTSGTTPRHRGS